jgi:hypothetical protein
LSELGAHAAADARALAPAREVSFHADDRLEALADAGALGQVLANLMSNAVIHTPDGTRVELSVRREGGDAVLEVRDHGSGLPADAGDRVFDRFWRAEGGRARGRGGAGLGLSIVREIVNSHHGTLLSVNFNSKALHRNADYLVYLPPGYTPSHRYSVFYLLHGSPGRPQVFIDIANMDVRLDNQLSQAHLQPMILVYPDGRIGGSTYSDSEWANTPSGQDENYVLDVVHDVDQRFSTLAERQDLGCGVFAFGESLGSTPTATIVHLLAISIVLACVPVLASAQQHTATAGPLAGEHVKQPGSLQAGYRTA